MRRIAPGPRQDTTQVRYFAQWRARVSLGPLNQVDSTPACCRSREKILDGVARLALLVEHEVAGALEDLDIGLGNEAPPGLRLLRRDELVLLAPDQERWHGEAVEIARQLRVVGVLPQEPRRGGHFAVAVADEVEVRLGGQIRLDYREISHH